MRSRPRGRKHPNRVPPVPLHPFMLRVQPFIAKFQTEPVLGTERETVFVELLAPMIWLDFGHMTRAVLNIRLTYLANSTHRHHG